MPSSPTSVVAAHEKKPSLQCFLQDRGWEEVGILGIGAQGPVLLIRQQGRDAGHARHSALKRSSHDEVRALKALAQCRNIMRLEEHFTNPGVNEVWARLEWLDGGSLRGCLRGIRPRKISEDAARFFLGEVLEGLQEIHRLGWMHRDIKAENIGLTKPHTSRSGQFECSVKLLDFDSAAPIPGSGDKLTEVIGTVENMAPEVFGGSYDERADLWSLGVVAFEVLFGYRPFNDACIDQVEEMVRNWKRYLVIPYDASEIASNFLRGLLTGPEDRCSSNQAARHPWISNARDPTCVGLAAAALSDALEKETVSAISTGIGAESRMAFSSSPVNSAFPEQRRGSLPAKLPQQNVMAASKGSRRLSERIPRHESSVLDGDKEFECLSRIRRSLSEWNAPVIGRVYGEATLPARPAFAEVRRGVSCPEVAYVEETSAASKDLGCEGDAKENQGGSPSPEDYSDYLRRVRSRTQEVMRAAEAVAAAKPARTSGRVRATEANSQNSTSSRPPVAEARRAANVVESPQRNLSHRSNDSEPAESPSRHLAGAQQRVKDLLSRLSTASGDAEAVRQQAAAIAASQAVSNGRYDPRESLSQHAVAASPPRAATMSRSPGSWQPESEPTPSSKDGHEGSPSPEVWLAQQRRRTEKLLGRLRQASEGIEPDADRSSRVWV